MNDIVDLASLEGQLIELAAPIQRGIEDNDYLGTKITTIGHVVVSPGDRDCPPHIIIGRSTFSLNTKVKRDRIYVRDYYILVE